MYPNKNMKESVKVIKEKNTKSQYKNTRVMPNYL